MDFFSKLGKKASKTYQITKEKASSLSEELKIRGKISDAKNSIEELYTEIGKIVYAEMQSGTDVNKDEINVKCDEISRLKINIEKFETEILALKNLKKCDGCFEELELNAEFCSKCGKKQPKIEKVEVEIKKETPDAKDAEVVEIKNVESDEESTQESNEENNNSKENENTNDNHNEEN